MSQFRRSFPLGFLTAGRLSTDPWIKELLQLWRAAGEGPLTDEEGHPVHLRFAVRAGTANFYRDGQSVARLKSPRGGDPYAKIHVKYVDEGPDLGQDTHHIDHRGITTRAGVTAPFIPGHVARWSRKANKHSGDEKRFVDQVVAANPNVIDLEMALPGISRGKTSRIDLVALESDGDGWRIVLWEVKRVGDGRARSEADTEPKVVAEQLDRYNTWVEANAEAVIAAYHETCRILFGLHAFAVGRGMNPGELGAGIRAVAASAQPPGLDRRVRLLIDATGTTEELARRRKTFIENGHLKKLQDRGHVVQMVGPGEAPVLEARS